MNLTINELDFPGVYSLLNKMSMFSNQNTQTETMKSRNCELTILLWPRQEEPDTETCFEGWSGGCFRRR